MKKGTPPNKFSSIETSHIETELVSRGQTPMDQGSEPLVLRNIKQLVTVCDRGESFKAGVDQGKISIIENATVVCHQGKIIFVGTDQAFLEEFPALDAVWIFEPWQILTPKKVLDLTGKCVVPGLVDSHTHPIWSGDRVHEFVLKLEGNLGSFRSCFPMFVGATYMEIHQKGGGIGFTVRHTKESSEEELAKLLRLRLNRMIKLGTTTVEAKSGYGLELQTGLPKFNPEVIFQN